MSFYLKGCYWHASDCTCEECMDMAVYYNAERTILTLLAQELYILYGSPRIWIPRTFGQRRSEPTIHVDLLIEDNTVDLSYSSTIIIHDGCLCIYVYRYNECIFKVPLCDPDCFEQIIEFYNEHRLPDNKVFQMIRKIRWVISRRKPCHVS